MGENENKADRLAMSAVLKLVPKFDEENVTTYFMCFEKLKERVGYPKEMWTLYLQSVLSGRALTVYSCMSKEECDDYDIVKESILSTYRLVLEAYRKKFKSLRKDENITYVEYGKKLERLFYDWLTSAKVEDFDDLKNLVLLENFKDSVSPKIKLYIEDRRKVSFAGATRLADEYSVTHNLSVSKKRNDPSFGRVQSSKGFSSSNSNSSYWQVPLSERARKISAFITPFGSFEPKVMAFGLKNAASTFQRLMNKVLNGINNCVVYLDDLVIFSETWKDHVPVLMMVLESAGVLWNATRSVKSSENSTKYDAIHRRDSSTTFWSSWESVTFMLHPPSAPPPCHRINAIDEVEEISKRVTDQIISFLEAVTASRVFFTVLIILSACPTDE
ncbi:uncharacterized protein LOC135209005 [Macrobrachium nipponense]|uniref:uncharacterized protein LOC135209005 n=1 Tax=Macrobrachium nipponense TaxID=159736 RepID=UPI0030C8C120